MCFEYFLAFYINFQSFFKGTEEKTLQQTAKKGRNVSKTILKFTVEKKNMS